MNQFRMLLGILIYLPSLTFAQSKIEGTVSIDMELGLIECSFNLSELPEIKNYKILLNKGMNVKYYKDAEGNLINYEGHYNGNVKGEAIEYSLIDTSNKVLNLPSSIQIEYKGAFPTYSIESNDFNSFDYKGIITFNGETLRATEQTKWYPVLYDIDNDRLLDRYLYDVTFKVKSKRENSIFINGNAPIQTIEHRFTSSRPYPLLIFIGKYNFISNNGDYILNASIEKATAEKVFKNIETIKDILENNLEMKFSDNIYLINHKAINKRKAGSSWGFNTYPTFAFTDLDFEKLVSTNGRFSNGNFKYFGHEFGHNYFGSNVLSGELKWFWLESFAEYLSFNIVEDLGAKEFLKEVLVNKLKEIENQKFTPLAKVTETNQITELYRYSLAPLILKSFEDNFGRKKTNSVIKKLLEYAKTQTLTIKLWESASEASGISANDFQRFKEKFIQADNFKENIITHINNTYNKE